MSLALDGYVADPNDGVAEVFDWYFNSGDVEFHTGGSDPMTFKVSEPSAKHLSKLYVALQASAIVAGLALVGPSSLTLFRQAETESLLARLAERWPRTLA